MILLRRRKKNVFQNLLEIIGETQHPCSEDRILKLDKRHSHLKNNSVDITMHSFHYPLIKEIQQASLVAYKNDWNNEGDKLHILKFRYEQKELKNYLHILKEMPIFTELLYHDKRGNETKRITYYKDHYIETRY